MLRYFQNTVVEPQEWLHNYIQNFRKLEARGKLDIYFWYFFCKWGDCIIARVFSCDVVDEVLKLLWEQKFRHVFAP